MKRLTILILGLGLVFGLIFFNNEPNGVKVAIGGETIFAEVAQTKESRRVGLSNHKSLESNQGMLFVWSEDKKQSMWMKGMDFPIDIIWISKDKKIVDYRKNVSPDSYPDYSFRPEEKARYVLEVSSGFIDKMGLQVGDRVYFEL